MNILVAFERSGVVRDAFIRRGHNAISCDLEPSASDLGEHIQGDALPLLRREWDMVIAHPPCSYLTAYTWSFRNQQRDRYGAVWWTRFHHAAAVFAACLQANAPKVAVENPPYMHPPARSMFGLPTCMTDFRNFGGPYRKRVGFWLKGLPPLMAYGFNPDAVSLVRDDISVGARERAGRGSRRSPSMDGVVGFASGGFIERSRLRSEFQPEMAAAMAEQWG